MLKDILEDGRVLVGGCIGAGLTMWAQANPDYFKGITPLRLLGTGVVVYLVIRWLMWRWSKIDAQRRRSEAVTAEMQASRAAEAAAARAAEAKERALWTPTAKWIAIELRAHGDALIFARGAFAELQVGSRQFSREGERACSLELRHHILESLDAMYNNGLLHHKQFTNSETFELNSIGTRRANELMPDAERILASAESEWKKI